MGTVRPKSKQGNTTNLNISFSTENEKKSCSGGIRTHDILLTIHVCIRIYVYVCLCVLVHSVAWSNEVHAGVCIVLHITLECGL